MFKRRYAVVCKNYTYHGLHQKEINAIYEVLKNERIKHDIYYGLFKVVNKNGKKKYRAIKHNKFPDFWGV